MPLKDPAERAAAQPFRGATLPLEVSAALAPTLKQYGPTRLVRAMLLAWMNMRPKERADWLAKAPSSSSDYLAAFRDVELTHAPAPSPAEVDESVKHFRAAARKFDKARMSLTENELRVAKRRLLDPDQPTLEQVGEEMGVTKERVRQLEEMATHKLTRWVLALLAGDQDDRAAGGE